MPSIPAVLKVISSVAAIAQPQISKFIDTKKEISSLKCENERLKKQIDTLQKQRLILIIITTLLCLAFIVALMIITKGIMYA